MRRDKLLLAVFMGAGLALAADKPAERDAAWVDERVKEWQPKAAEKRIDEIGWAKDIRTAEKLAKDNNRPVFLFTLDGRMNIGRC